MLEKHVEKEMDLQENQLEKHIITTITKNSSSHMDSLYSKYAMDLCFKERNYNTSMSTSKPLLPKIWDLPMI